MTTHFYGRKRQLIGSRGRNQRKKRGREAAVLEGLLADPAQIAGFYPVYLNNGGQGVDVWKRDGSILTLGLSVNALVNRLANAYLLNLTVLKHHLQDLLDVGYGVPLPLAPNLVLVYVKTREPAVKRDKVSGYVNLCALADDQLVPGKAPCPAAHGLPLENGSVFPCLTQQKTMNQRVQRANLALMLTWPGVLSAGTEKVAEAGRVYGEGGVTGI